MLTNSNKAGDELLSSKERHLKWQALDGVELVLMWVCAALLAGFTLAVLLDIVTRFTGTPVYWLQEAILGAFVWGIFLGGAVAVRRNQHFVLSEIAKGFGKRGRQVLETINHLILLAVALCLAYFGFIYSLQNLDIYSQPSGLPLAVVTSALPVAGTLVAAFVVERLVNGWRCSFHSPEVSPDREQEIREPHVEVGGSQ